MKTQNEIATEHGIHPLQVTQWKKQMLAGLPSLFGSKPGRNLAEQDALIAQLYQQIGQLKVEVDWLKKTLTASSAEKRSGIEREHPRLSVSRQCELLGLARSSYYSSDKASEESEENLILMRWIDAQYTKTPQYGSPKMTFLLRQAGYGINHKRVERLMRRMGLRAIAPGKSTSTPAPGHAVYSYLLRGVKIEGVGHVWSSDITYIRLQRGFVYLTAAIDWFSRYMLSWELSTTLDTDFCVRALEAALSQGTPQIFNTDQGCQFTSEAFTERLKRHRLPF